MASLLVSIGTLELEKLKGKKCREERILNKICTKKLKNNVGKGNSQNEGKKESHNHRKVQGVKKKNRSTKTSD